MKAISAEHIELAKHHLTEAGFSNIRFTSNKEDKHKAHNLKFGDGVKLNVLADCPQYWNKTREQYQSALAKASIAAQVVS